MSTWSLHDPNQYWVHDPIILGNDPIFTGSWRLPVLFDQMPKRTVPPPPPPPRDKICPGGRFGAASYEVGLVFVPYMLWGFGRGSALLSAESSTNVLPAISTIPGVVSPFFPKTNRFPWVSGGFLERTIPGKNGEGTPRTIASGTAVSVLTAKSPCDPRQ